MAAPIEEPINVATLKSPFSEYFCHELINIINSIKLHITKMIFKNRINVYIFYNYKLSE